MAASPRQRFYAYVHYLQAAGFDVSVSPLFSDRYLQSYFQTGRRPAFEVLRGYLDRLVELTRSRRFDCLMIHFELFPYLPYLLERLWLPERTRVVFDFDDAIHHQYDRHGNAVIRYLLSDKISRLVARAGAVTAGNDYLAEFARQSGCPRVEVLPTSIDTAKYAETQNTQTTDSGLLTIGWMGSRSTGPYLESLYPVIERVAKAYPVRLLVIGHQSNSSFEFPVEFRAWEESREIADLQEMDIGIMPLPDTPWERGKCGYKLIQYMGVSKPVVASPVGVNATLVEHGINGFQARSDEDWYQALRQLIENPGLRASMGRAGRSRVEREYSLDVNGPRLVQLLKDVVAD